MNASGKWLLASVGAALALAATDAAAQHRGGGSRASGHWGGPAAQVGHGSDHWSRGGRGWDGRWSGVHARGGYNYWAPRWSFYLGVPVLWGSWYWGAPYWYDYYPRETVIYREVEREASYPDHAIGPATTEVPPATGMPSQAPLYMNYCESTQAYFPKVTTCAEGWKLRSASPQP